MEIVKLSDILNVTDVVEIAPGKGIEVRALNLEEMVSIFWNYQDAFLSVYSESQQDKPNYTGIIATAPRMVAQIIAMAAGDPDSVESVQKLAVTVQLIALAKIVKLSVPDPKKLAEALNDLTGALNKATESQVNPSKTTTGKSSSKA